MLHCQLLNCSVHMVLLLYLNIQEALHGSVCENLEGGAAYPIYPSLRNMLFSIVSTRMYLLMYNTVACTHVHVYCTFLLMYMYMYILEKFQL